MKKIFCIFLLLFPLSLFPNDGWFSSLNTSGGSIYSEAEHPAISLRKEALFFLPLKEYLLCRVNYLFHNNSSKKETVQAGFPLIFTYDMEYNEKTKSVYFSEYNQFRYLHFIQIFYQNRFQIKEMDEGFEVKVKKTIQDFAFNQKYSLENFKKNLLQKSKTAKDWYEDFFIDIPLIVQDNASVPITQVLLNAEIVNKQDNIYTLTLTVHFFHELIFSPEKNSEVQIEWLTDHKKSGGVTDKGYERDYSWKYIFDPAKGWKNSIGSIFLIFPKEIEPVLPKAFEKRDTALPKVNVYFTEHYEPEKNDMIQLDYTIQTENETNKTTLVQKNLKKKGFSISKANDTFFDKVYQDYLSILDPAPKLSEKAYKAYKSKKSLEARNLYESFIKYSDSGKDYFYYGNVLSNFKDRYPDALSAYLKAINLGVTDLPVYYNIACLYSKMKNKEKGFYYLKRSLSFNELKNPSLMNKDPDLEFLRKQKEWKELGVK